MFKKTLAKPTLAKKKKTIPLLPNTTAKPEQLITESLKVKVLPYIINDFAQALKELKAGESIRFGKLGTFKKSKRTVNGYTGYQYSFKAHSLVKK